MNTPSFGLVGAGWRGEFFLRIARDLPERFPLAGVVVRDPAKRERFRAAWPSVRAFASVDELLGEAPPGFVVTSVGWSDNLPLIESLVAGGLPILSETPVAPALEDLHRVHALAASGARIQVAEQYLFQPLQAARLALARSGRLGTIHEADVSIAHGYHGLSLLRHYLDVGLQMPQRIQAKRFKSRITAGPGRAGGPEKESVTDSERVVAYLDFGDRLGVYDFAGDQYFSWIRSPRFLLRGEKGEINGTAVRLLQDYRTPVRFELIRRDAGTDGNLEGFHHQAILGGGEVFYENPFPGPRWSDDEIALATSLARMQTYVETGEEFYSVAAACQDRYLDLLVSEAAGSGAVVEPVPQPWSAAS